MTWRWDRARRLFPTETELLATRHPGASELAMRVQLEKAFMQDAEGRKTDA